MHQRSETGKERGRTKPIDGKSSAKRGKNGASGKDDEKKATQKPFWKTVGLRTQESEPLKRGEKEGKEDRNDIRIEKTQKPRSSIHSVVEKTRTFKALEKKRWAKNLKSRE